MQAVRYCATPAGRVAWSAMGSGPPLLLDSGWVTHLRRGLELFGFGPFVAALAERFTVIRYDKPGSGLAAAGPDGGPPNVPDLSFEAQVAVTLAVADSAGADRFRMFGASQGGQVAAAVAARHPERVEELVLYGTCARGRDLAPARVRDSLVALVRAHWGLGSTMLASIFIPEPGPEEVAAFTEGQRACAPAAVAGQTLQVYYDTDVAALLPLIRARTLVLHREADRAAAFALGREVAALIPGATLVPLTGSSHLFYHGPWAEVRDAALDFFGPPAGPRLTGRELQVAGLIADGLTNQAIASRLAIAPRTAEAHVENIRRKLEVRSRAQIAAWITAHPADGYDRAGQGGAGQGGAGQDRVGTRPAVARRRT